MTGIFANLFERRFHVSQTPPAYVDKWGAGWEASSGVRVDPDSALQSTAVFGCVRILAETISALPLILYERTEQGKARADNHPLYPILHDLPNPEMTSLNMREALIGHVALRGNCYAEIERSKGGQVLNLWPLRPDRMEDIRRVNGRLVYSYRLPDAVGGQLKELDMSLVQHVRGFGSNGIVGYSPIQLARNAIGLGMATEEFGSRFFSNGARPTGVLEHPGKLSDKAYDRLKGSFEGRHTGLENAHRLAILEEGLKYTQIGIPPEDAQFLETRKFQVSEIARIFRIPPHMLADLDRATFSNIEHMSIEFVTFSLMPWLVRWEQEIKRSLLTPAERQRYYAEHLVSGLLRGDLQSRYQAYATARQNGWLSANDIRELENMNLVEGGDVYLVPLNMVPADQVGGQPATDSNQRSAIMDGVINGLRANVPTETATVESPEERGRRAARKRRKLVDVYAGLYQQTAERVLRREINDIHQAAKKYLERRSLDQFNAWLSEYYDEHEEFVRTAFGPVNSAYGLVVGEAAEAEIGVDIDLADVLQAFLGTYLLAYAARHVGTSVNQVRSALQKALASEIDLVQALDELGQHWLDVRAGQIVAEETVRLNNATAKEVYKGGGRSKVQWVSFGENCPYCDDLDGKTVGIDENFLPADTDYKPDGADRPLRTASNIGHAPAHDGCLPGDARVLAEGIAASSERWYEGDLIVIQMARGNQLSCTPNHPILTRAGWVAAHLLKEGDHVICDAGMDWKAVGDVDGQDMPARIQDVAKTIGIGAKVVAIPVPSTTADFHGDGLNGEIAIVRADGELVNRMYTTLPKQIREKALIGRYADAPFLTCSGGHALFVKSFDPASGGEIGSNSLGPASGGSHLSSPYLAGSGRATNFYTGLEQTEANGRTANAQLTGQGILGLSRLVFADDVICIKREAFHGMVYNLQTQDGWYIAEGILTHNCDCMIAAA